MVAVLVPIVALSALGAAGVMQRYRGINALHGVVTQVGRLEQTLHLYAGLVGEKTGSESVAVAAGLDLSPAEASRLAGYDIEAQLRSARAVVDAAIADGAGKILGTKVSQLAALRVRIDAGDASETVVRRFFLDSIDVVESAWLAQRFELTNLSDETFGSAGLRRAVAGLRDVVEAFISGSKATTAAGALTVPGVPGKATAATDLAAAYAVYTRASFGLTAEFGEKGKAAWERLIVVDPDVKAFQKFLVGAIERPSGQSAGASIADIATTFRAGLIFQDHLRSVVGAAATDVVTLAAGLRSDAQRDLNRYLLAIGLIAASSAAIALVTARKIVTPLRRLASRASEVSAGVIDGDPLDAIGPYEVASVTDTFNEIVANLAVLDASTLALAGADLDNPVLARSVPGRIGGSLRNSVDKLRDSIRDNEELRSSLESTEARFRELAEWSPDIIWRFSRLPEPHFEYLSPSFETLTGIAAGAVEADIGVLIAALDSEGRVLVADMAAGRNFRARADLTLRRADDTVVVFELRAVETPDGTQGVGRDVTDVRALQTSLKEQAGRDPLTGLANRRLLDELLVRAIRRADRSGAPIAVAFLDLDDFKAVNDTYGHEAGDAVLRATADRLQAAVRDADVVARYGGDEFVVVYEGADDDAIQHFGERIDAALSSPIDVGGGVAVRCAPSVGVADSRNTANTPAALIRAADQAMLEVKRARGTARRPDHGLLRAQWAG